jgi:hypothetical protein
LLHFGESVRFAALVGNDNRSAFFNFDGIGFEVP